jgi:uridine phosphorylase
MNHLKFTSEDINSSEWAIITGNPFRLEAMSKILMNHGKEIYWDREFRCWAGFFDKTPLLMASHGIGGPSTSILIEELAMLGIRKIIRMGTSGAIQDFIKPGDLVVTTASVRLDGASKHYAPIEYPAVADLEITLGLIESAKKEGFNVHSGITASSDTFYPGQERYDSCSAYVLSSLQGSLSEWKKLRVLNFEMESATLLTQAQVLGLRSACITGIVANRNEKESIVEDIAQTVELRCMQSIQNYIKSNICCY